MHPRPNVLLCTTLCAVALALSAACGDRKEAPKAQVAEPVPEEPSSGPAVDLTSSPGLAELPVDIVAANRLWSLAPDDAVMGAIVVPGAGDRLHKSLLSLAKVARQQPLGRLVVKALVDAARRGDVNVFDPGGFNKVGIDLSLGSALFVSGRKRGLMILPVSDREAFVDFVGGRQRVVDDVTYDKLARNIYCAKIRGYYACRQSVELLHEFDGTERDGPMGQAMEALPEQVRGDIEIALDTPRVQNQIVAFPKEFKDYIGGAGVGVASLRLGHGGVSLRAFLQGAPRGILGGATRVGTEAREAAAKLRPSALFHLRLPPELLVLPEGLGDPSLPGGLKLKADILPSLSGEFALYTPRSEHLWGRFEIGVRDPGPIRMFLNAVCKAAGQAQRTITGVQVEVGDGQCRASVDVAKLPIATKDMATLFHAPLPIAAAIEGNRLSITLGDSTAVAVDAASSDFGKLAVHEDWNLAVWGEGISMASGVFERVLRVMPLENPDAVQLALWLASHVYEVGLLAAVRPDGAHFAMRVSTYAGDPPPAFAAYQQAVVKALDAGDSKELRALGLAFPNTMAGRQARLGSGGSVLAGLLTGLGAAIAAPAFMTLRQREMQAAEATSNAVPVD